MPRKALRAVFGNFRLKLWALIIALGVWFYANARMTDEAVVRIAIEITPPAGCALLWQSETMARATIAGPRLLVARMRSDMAQNYHKFAYRLSEQELTAGSAVVEVSPEWLRPGLPEPDLVQLKFRDIAPSSVEVFVSPIKQRVVPVKVRAVLEPAPGYRLAEPPSASPDQVTVRGPAVAVDALDAVPTAELVLLDIRANDHRPVALLTEHEVTLPNGVCLAVPLNVVPPSVIANVYVSGEEDRERAFEDLPVLLLAPSDFPYVVELSPGEARVTVTVIAQPAELRKLKPDSVKAYVDLESLAREQIEPGGSAPYQERVRVQLTPAVRHSSARVDPATVTLLLKNPGQ